MFALADRLWDRAPADQGARDARGPLVLCVDVSPQSGDGLPDDTCDERWTVGPDDAHLSLDPHLSAHIDCARGTLEARVSAALLVTHPSLVARLLLETPAAALLGRRAYGVVHGGAVVGPSGAVVLRGASGAGKSTLVAAAHQAGLETLGDEAILVAREDPDDLLSAVRDVMLLPDTWNILGLPEPPRNGSAVAEKRRLDLFASSQPKTRRARRIATVLLGTRSGGPAALEPLAPGTFLEEFQRGDIPQERWSGTPDHIAVHWSRGQAYRLTGTEDLAGAVELLLRLTGTTAIASHV